MAVSGVMPVGKTNDVPTVSEPIMRASIRKEPSSGPTHYGFVEDNEYVITFIPPEAGEEKEALHCLHKSLEGRKCLPADNVEVHLYSLPMEYMKKELSFWITVKIIKNVLNRGRHV